MLQYVIFDDESTMCTRQSQYAYHFYDLAKIGAIIGFIWCMYVQIHMIHMLSVAMNTDTMATLSINYARTFCWHSS